jgi:signal transduction histidine kinase
VTLGVRDLPDLVEIRVSNDGDGVPSQEAERIFDRFVRLDESRARDAGGSGLGLAIVAQIVSARGGAIELDDTALSGATFVLQLPRTT